MVLIGLFVTAEFENVSEVRVPPDHTWFLDIRESDGFEVRENVSLSAAEIVDTGNSRNSVHFSINFKDSRKKGTITIKGADSKFTDDGYSCVCIFDCRGVDILSWNPSGGYQVVCTSGNVISDVEFEQDSWVGFDEVSHSTTNINIQKSEKCASVLNLKYELRVV
ncbi:hypothetical protein BEWA_025390 [Theileria equi strain WA]|uniref:Uncharacterized protein n=1 Tax=Theileria equi strain WA TaxID=1537102 RepID=L0AVW4_THEEQ|nr:hypothetical protein BEWA_025390 [Theileria equi strain WA]AFZ79690.1 hypothetical protein BEWA_025390 [Theileria equi strain WA]|eukprot:XP_004829356.1 hypothetical protein BEWA_025390 [Theileria equi strain WA]